MRQLRQHNSRLVWQLSLVAFGVLLLSAGWVTAVYAHGRILIGPYAVVVGWQDEPPIVGERNALRLVFTRDDTGEPVENLSGALIVEIIYKDNTYRAGLSPTHEPGVYIVELLPTVADQFTVHLTGQIGETAVDENVPAEAVISAAQIQFPDVVADPGKMQSQIKQLQIALIVVGVVAGIGLVTGLSAMITSMKGREEEEDE